MKIAIPFFGTRISPRFDHTKKFLLVAAENGNIIERQELLTEGWTSLTRIKRLRELGIDTLICSGIDCFSARQLNFNGIRIYSWVTGEVEDALRCFLEGRLEPGVMIGSDGHQCGRWKFKGGRLHRESGQRDQGRGRGQGFGRGQGQENLNRKYNHYARKEVISMPRRDGTGPMGYGPKTGRGAGFCADAPDSNNVNQMPGGGQGKGRGQGGGQGKGRGQGGGQGKGRGQGRP